MWPAFAFLVMFCWTGVSQATLPCPWNLNHIDNSIILLQDMGRYLPVECLGRLTYHIFPDNVFSNAEEASVPGLVLRTMQMCTEVFRGNLSTTSWDMVKVEALRSEVFLQTTDLQQCVDQDAETDPTAAMALERFSDQLTALHTQERCSWELIRNEFRIAFRQLKKFQGPRTPNSSK